MKFKVGMFSFVCASVMSFGISSQLDFRPPGTAEVVDNFFYDVNEVTNITWKEYLSFIKEREGVNSERYKANLPDTTVWIEKESFNEPLVETYFSHPAYDHYPVVGITHQQATDFCAWRTEAVKMMLEANDFKGPKSFQYRLPTETEWSLMANAGLSKKSKKLLNKKVKKDGMPINNAKGNFRHKVKEGEHDPFNDPHILKIPIPSPTYLPNKYGVYNIHGNVAEMVVEPGIAMGGSFNHYYEDIVPENKPLNYEGAEKWLGFRCVCEIMEE